MKLSKSFENIFLWHYASGLCAVFVDNSLNDDTESAQISKCCRKLIKFRRELYGGAADGYIESTPELEEEVQLSNEGVEKGKEWQNVTGHKNDL